jgi:hypothetical protein|tara:strand:+ start:63 stop:446 length:384 start_codon:yes stop_codon:yes gene_type:complete
LLKQKYSKSQKKWDEYLIVCERLGKEPDYNKMPIDDRDFPYEVQLAFFIHSLMPDRWEGMSGSYLGKDWGALGALYDIHNIEDKRTVTFFLKNVDILVTNQINKEVEKQHKQIERKGGAAIVPKGIK